MHGRVAEGYQPRWFNLSSSGAEATEKWVSACGCGPVRGAQNKDSRGLGQPWESLKYDSSKASPPVTAQGRSLDHSGIRTSGSRTPGDGRALRQPTPSATWQPRTQRTLRARPRGFKAHGFASPLFSGFALSRMKGVAIQARRESLPPKPPQNLATSLLATTLERESTPGKSLKLRFLEKPVS